MNSLIIITQEIYKAKKSVTILNNNRLDSAHLCISAFHVETKTFSLDEYQSLDFTVVL
jgi:hypothetical protein